MTRLIITTQVFENYAYEYGHDHWKAKGGCEYSLTIPDNMNQPQIDTLIQNAIKAIEKDNRFYREYVVGRPEVLEDGQLTEFEEMQILYDGKVDHPIQEIRVRDLEK